MPPEKILLLLPENPPKRISPEEIIAAMKRIARSLPGSGNEGWWEIEPGESLRPTWILLRAKQK